MNPEDFRRAKTQALCGAGYDTGIPFWVKLKIGYTKGTGCYRFPDISVRLCISENHDEKSQ